jgi:hypothetical protein
MRLKYRRATFTIECNKPTVCEACGGKGKIDLHHYKYEFKTSEIRKNKLLILKNTIWVCFPCHQVADGIRRTEEQPERTRKIMDCINSKRTTL